MLEYKSTPGRQKTGETDLGKDGQTDLGKDETSPTLQTGRWGETKRRALKGLSISLESPKSQIQVNDKYVH